MTEATVAKKKAPSKAETAPKPKAKKTSKKEGVLAVFATGGKQYAVYEGESLKIEKILGELEKSGRKEYEEGDTVAFTDVLLTANGDNVTLGTPFIKGASVSATITKIGKAKKIEVIKYKAKSRYFKRYGHRQPFFEVRIDSIK